ncbi:uncharacterized protein LOC129786887 [Lutzomyia longipalpis]|uniref:uncharacterized protein LOC129786887 n=1 Tax=Lutzomyia longipalpis TaxID=7200 RepID=UPI002483CD1C|nr:uncharacterized protein LOC129786887 [Lutzomyia longipalpis]
MAHLLGVIVLVGLLSAVGAKPATSLHRDRRFLIVPPTAPTRHQFIAGIGIPVDLQSVAITSGYVFKAQYFLPTQGSDWRPSEDTWQHDWRRKRDLTEATAAKVENYTANEILIEESTDPPGEDIEDLSFLDDDYPYDEEKATKEATEAFWGKPPEEEDENYGEKSRWNTYKGLEAIVAKSGFDGRSCILRSICEAALRPFSGKSGILAELLNIVLSPSTTNDKISEHSDNEYFHAEKQGKLGAPCGEIFKNCPVSILDIFTAVPEALNEVVKKKLE